MPGRSKKLKPFDATHLARCLQASYDAYRLGQSLAYREQVTPRRPDRHWLRLAEAFVSAVSSAEDKADEILRRAEREAVDAMASRLGGLR